MTKQAHASALTLAVSINKPASARPPIHSFPRRRPVAALGFAGIAALLVLTTAFPVEQRPADSQGAISQTTAKMRDVKASAWSIMAAEAATTPVVSPVVSPIAMMIDHKTPLPVEQWDAF